MNPALAARCFLLICFTQKMTYFVYDGVTGATPLAQLRERQCSKYDGYASWKCPGNDRRDVGDRDYNRSNIINIDRSDRVLRIRDLISYHLLFLSRFSAAMDLIRGT